MRREGRQFLIALTLLVLMGTAVRLPLLSLGSRSYRLSESFNIEEVETVRISTGMLNKHTLNPHFFGYPTLFYYLSLPIEAALSASGHGSWRAYLIGTRMLALLFGIGSIVLVAFLARRIAGDFAGLIAATVMALDRTMIDLSALAKPNSAQIFFLLAAFLLLLSLAARPRLPLAIGAAALLAMAMASKWLGALGLAALVLAPLLSADSAIPRGPRRILDTLRTGIRARIVAWHLAAPLLAFAAVFVLCVPFALLSPREFGFGLAQTFAAQSHRRDLPPWMPMIFALHSLGPVGAFCCTFGLGTALFRLARWSGNAEERGLLLVFAWMLGYGFLLLCVFVRLPSYLDLAIPFLAILGGCAWPSGPPVLGSRAARTIALAVVLVGGALANANYASARARLSEHADTRMTAGAWLDQHAAPGDSVIADLGIYVPDRLKHTSWNWWGGPPRTIYDENATWGWDPVWPAWYGGHRRLVFENAKWTAPMALLERRPRWVLASDEWAGIRAHPSGASETAAPEYDRSLSDGSAGYAVRARFAPAAQARGPWWLPSPLAARGGEDVMGPAITIYERIR
jgi:4-amino-4-deoxy-L-arabinose transferase-like glycosyltransferase